MKKLLTLSLLATLLLTACANPNPPTNDATTDAPDNGESTMSSIDESTVAIQNDTTVPEQIGTTPPEQNTERLENETVSTQSEPEQTEVISSPLIVSRPDIEHPDDVDVLNPIPYKAYVYESLHSLPLISNSGYYSWYNKVPYGFMYCELIEETDAPSSYSITVNDNEYHGIYKESYINNYFGTLGSIKRKYEISDSDKEYFLIEASTNEIVYINLKPIADANDQPVSEQEAFQLGVAFIETQISKSAHLDVRNYRYEGILLSNAKYYTLYYKRYINEICVDDQYQVSINLSNGKIETFKRLADCSEMESMSGYIDFDLAKLCADEKMREVTRKYFYVTEKEIGEPEVRAIRLSSNGAFCMVYEYPVYKPKSKETAYLSILVCVLNPDFER